MYTPGRFSPSSVAQDLFDRTCKFATPSEDRFLPIARDISGYPPSPTSDEPKMGFLPLTSNKCRLLPCRTFVSTGSCCYGTRCVFLHDEGLVSKPVFVKYLRKAREDNTPDSFFWPMMPAHMVKAKVNDRNEPEIGQSYLIPAPYVGQSGMNHYAVYSMWEHFLDFLVTDSMSVVTQPRPVPPLNPRHANNHHTGRRRLSCFHQLSQGISLV